MDETDKIRKLMMFCTERDRRRAHLWALARGVKVQRAYGLLIALALDEIEKRAGHVFLPDEISKGAK